MAQNHLLRGVQSVFQVHGVNAAGAVVLRRQFKCRQMVPFFTKLHRLRERLIAQRTQMINMLRGHVLCLIADEHSLRPIIDGLLAVHQQVDKQETILDVPVRKKAKADATTRRLMSVPAYLEHVVAGQARTQRVALGLARIKQDAATRAPDRADGRRPWPPRPR